MIPTEPASQRSPIPPASETRLNSPTESSRVEVSKRKFASESSRSRAPKRNFPRGSSQAAVPKAKLSSQGSQANPPTKDPKLQMPTNISKVLVRVRSHIRIQLSALLFILNYYFSAGWSWDSLIQRMCEVLVAWQFGSLCSCQCACHFLMASVCKRCSQCWISVAVLASLLVCFYDSGLTKWARHGAFIGSASWIQSVPSG